MISKLIVAVLVELGSRLLTFAIAAKAKREREELDAAESAKRVAAVKSALNEAVDGQPVTKEQRAKLNSAFRDLVRGSRPGV